MSKVAKVVGAVALFAVAIWAAPFIGKIWVARLITAGNYALRTRDSNGREWIALNARLR